MAACPTTQCAVKRTALALAASAALLGAGCGDGLTGTGSEAGNSSMAYLTRDLFVKLPTALADSVPSSYQKSLAKRADDCDSPYDAIELYDGVRWYCDFADELVHNDEFGVAAIVTGSLTDIPWDYIRDVGSWTGDENGFRYTAGYDANAVYPYQVQVDNIGMADDPVALTVAFNGSEDTPAGRVYYLLDAWEGVYTDSVQLACEFAEDAAGVKYLDIDIVVGREPAGKDAASTLKFSYLERDGIVHVSGCSYHPHLDSILPDTVGHCYVFTGVADTLANEAVVNLGLPPGTYDDNDAALYTEYGIANLYARYALHYEIPQLDDTLKQWVATSYARSLSIDSIYLRIAQGYWTADSLEPASTIDDMTVDDLKAYLALNQDISDLEARAELLALQWLVLLDQPVFFDALGYAGNGPAPADIPPGFEQLAAIDPELASFVPSEVAALTLAP